MEFQGRKIVLSKGIKAENAQVGFSKSKTMELFLPYVRGKCLDGEVEKGQVEMSRQFENPVQKICPD